MIIEQCYDVVIENVVSRDFSSEINKKIKKKLTILDEKKYMLQQLFL